MINSYLKLKGEVIQNSTLNDETARLKIQKIEKYQKDAKKLKKVSIVESVLSGLMLINTMRWFKVIDIERLIKGNYTDIVANWISTIGFSVIPVLIATLAAKDISRSNILEDKAETLKEELSFTDSEKVKRK